MPIMTSAGVSFPQAAHGAVSVLLSFARSPGIDQLSSPLASDGRLRFVPVLVHSTIKETQGLGQEHENMARMPHRRVVLDATNAAR